MLNAKTSQTPPGGSDLRNVGLVRDEREVLHGPAADVGLQQDVHFAEVVLRAAGHRQHARLGQVVVQLTQLLVPNLRKSRGSTLSDISSCNLT